MASASPTTSSEIDPIARRFTAWRGLGRRALIPYITAGYPAPAQTVQIMHAMIDAGADMIELGVPFSDPVADGPTIQRSSQRALEQGVTLSDVLRTLTLFRRGNAEPVVLFTYLNPVLGYGIDNFLRDAANAGADGLLLTDLPAGADPELEEAIWESPLSFIRLVAPTTSPQRVLEIAARAQGFLYYVGRLGVTGARDQLRAETVQEVADLRRRVTLPIAVGFGVSTPDHARELGAVADGVVIGSALIDALDTGGVTALAHLLSSLRDALDHL
jgi:tryptophan synthase alpha chain